MINVGDYVTRRSYNHDILFKVINKINDKYILSGVNVRLNADACADDLVLSDNRIQDDEDIISKVNDEIILDRSSYFYMPGTVLHIDGDESYLKRCMNLYKKSNVKAFGKVINEKNIYKECINLLNTYNPDVLVITGHDSYIKKLNKFSNSEFFIKAVKEARKYEKSSSKLVVIAGACQSDYEGLISSGATYASSPKKINIHALDPAIIAVNICLYEKGKQINVVDILKKTKCGEEGMGGIITEGLMDIGYPRNEGQNEYK